METLVYLHEVARVRSQADLYDRFLTGGLAARLPAADRYPRLAMKMATGSGKTKVMALAIAWQYLNAVCEPGDYYAPTTLIIAPNVIVLERLAKDFRNGVIFRADPIIPPSLAIHWDFHCYVRVVKRLRARGRST
jgi:type III restriction enzyme